MCTLKSIEQMAQAGDKMRASSELARYLRESPDDVQAWMLLAELLDEPARQAECYRRVLRLAPDHVQATGRLRALEQSRETASHADIVIPDLFDDNVDTLSDEEASANWERAHLTKHVLHELVDGLDRRTLILQVCKMGKMQWSEAEAFVTQVADEHQAAIAKRQPLLVLAYTAASTGPLYIFLLLGLFSESPNLAKQLVASSHFPYTTAFVVVLTCIGLIALSQLKKNLIDRC